ncbi:hypothetical protein OT109_00170 [Phycisphaeraceae bacterium D3-23]
MSYPRLIASVLCLFVVVCAGPLAFAGEPCRIEVIDADNGWPVPLVELRTTNHQRFVTDNAGVIALDAPELMGRATFFHIEGHGYCVPADGFGYAGVRITAEPGQTIRIEVNRTNIAKRLGRLTGTGLFAESQQLGDDPDWQDGPTVGQDTVQLARYNDKLFWLWGDTTLLDYPLGVFDSTAATTDAQPFASFEPPLRPVFDYYIDDTTSRPRGVADLSGSGPTWLGGMIALPGADGREHLVATYAKIRGFLHAYERGLCEWDDTTQSFERVRVLWHEDAGDRQEMRWHNGHPFRYTDAQGERWVAVGNPMPTIRFPATYEAWRDPSTWLACEPGPPIQAADGSGEVVPHTGSIAYNAYRDKWVVVFMQRFGSPSAFGELWYAEADDPMGAWGPAVKILSHNNYTFYNPRIHPELTGDDDSFIVFEGTYTAMFADDPEPTPRYDYNQILYRLDLDDPQLAPSREE